MILVAGLITLGFVSLTVLLSRHLNIATISSLTELGYLICFVGATLSFILLMILITIKQKD